MHEVEIFNLTQPKKKQALIDMKYIIKIGRRLCMKNIYSIKLIILLFAQNMYILLSRENR